MLEYILIVSGVVFWLIVLFVAAFYLIEVFQEWRYWRVFKYYGRKRIKEEKGEEV